MKNSVRTQFRQEGYANVSNYILRSRFHKPLPRWLPAMPLLACVVFAVFPPCFVEAADTDRLRAGTGGEAVSGEIVDLEEYRILGQHAESPLVEIPAIELSREHAVNLAEAFTRLPGVTAQKRGTDVYEPNIRGMGFDRVATSINGVTIPNAAPTHTASPLNAIGPGAASQAIVVKAIPSVTYGLPATGGRLVVETADWAFAPPATGLATGYARAVYMADREGYSLSGLSEGAGADGLVRYRATFFRNDLGDYSTPDNHTIGAEHRDWGVSLNFGYVPTDHHMITASVFYRDQEKTEHISLPLDAFDTQTTVFTLGYEARELAGLVSGVRVKAGYGYTDPYLSNADRMGVPLFIYADSEAESWNASAMADVAPAELGVLTLGADFSQVTRDAIRHRGPALDHIWPNTIYETVGLFVEWNQPLTETLNLRLGARADYVSSDARDADKLAFGTPIDELYVAYNGPAAAEIDQSEWVAAANALLRWQSGENLNLFVGAGFSMMPAQPVERYRAFLPALGGGWELGNPAVDTETKWELDAGGRYRNGIVELNWDLFVYHISDYIQRTAVGVTTPPPPPPPGQVVYGYRNIDATFYGGEAGAVIIISDHISFPLTFAATMGYNDDSDVRLPDVPPWEASAGLRWSGNGDGWRWRLEGELNFVGERTNPAPDDMPIFRDAQEYALINVKGTIELLDKTLLLEAGVSNLVDEEYHEYLMPPAGSPVPVGTTLSGGEAIPGQGREFWLAARYVF